MASLKSNGLRNSSNVFPQIKTVIKVFKAFYVFAPCLKNEAVNQVKANFIYWKDTSVSLCYTHRLAVCAHFERHLAPSLWTMVLQTSESVYHLNLYQTVLKKSLFKRIYKYNSGLILSLKPNSKPTF